MRVQLRAQMRFVHGRDVPDEETPGLLPESERDSARRLLGLGG